MKKKTEDLHKTISQLDLEHSTQEQQNTHSSQVYTQHSQDRPYVRL